MSGETILSVLMERDGKSAEEALDLIEAAKRDLNERLADGEQPHNICMEWFRLEPDYIMELL